MQLFAVTYRCTVLSRGPDLASTLALLTASPLNSGYFSVRCRVEALVQRFDNVEREAGDGHNDGHLIHKRFCENKVHVCNG